MTEEWTIVGPTLQHGTDPETGETFTYSALCAFLVVDGVEHGIMLTCSADLATNPDEHRDHIAALVDLAKTGVRARV